MASDSDIETAKQAEQIATLQRDMKEVRTDVKYIKEIAASVQSLAKSVESLTKSVEKMQAEPADSWKKFKWSIVALFVSVGGVLIATLVSTILK